MGSGGSARTALFTAIMNGANKVTLVARSIDKARKVLSEAKKKFTGSVVMANETDSQMAADAIANATLLINSTPLGMGVLSGKTPVDKKYLHKSLTVFDMVYAPAVTRLLKDAHSVGAKTVQGIDMLVYQGMASFELWTGKRASYTLFRQGTGL
jgi:shikimate dehydrogenase